MNNETQQENKDNLNKLELIKKDFLINSGHLLNVTALYFQILKME